MHTSQLHNFLLPCTCTCAHGAFGKAYTQIIADISQIQVYTWALYLEVELFLEVQKKEEDMMVEEDMGKDISTSCKLSVRVNCWGCLLGVQLAGKSTIS